MPHAAPRGRIRRLLNVCSTKQFDFNIWRKLTWGIRPCCRMVSGPRQLTCRLCAVSGFSGKGDRPCARCLQQHQRSSSNLRVLRAPRQVVFCLSAATARAATIGPITFGPTDYDNTANTVTDPGAVQHLNQTFGLFRDVFWWSARNSAVGVGSPDYINRGIAWSRQQPCRPRHGPIHGLELHWEFAQRRSKLHGRLRHDAR
jgi:hypothetical protein